MGSIEETLRQVAAYDPVAVIAGGEIGVELADALSEALGLATNGTALSAARRDKYTMIEAVKAAGVPVGRQLRITSESELRRWHEQIDGRTVVKPVRSAGSEGVHFCASPGEAAAAYHTLLGQTNLFSEPNESVVAQEYLTGTEYVVNTVSREGRHHVSDIWRTVRFNVNGTMDLLGSFYIIPSKGAVQDQLAAYACRVLDAVGIRYGPAHIEIRTTADGPRLIEIGARIGGSDNPYYAMLATGESQLNWTVDAYVNPARFDSRYQEDYTIREYFASVVMLCPFKGILRSYPLMASVERLESLHDIRLAANPGDHVVPTVDDTTSPLTVNLKHSVEEIVMRDMATLRYLDGHAFYDVI